jgi:hypothetical protein
MTAAGIAFIAGGIATLICLRSVLFGRAKPPESRPKRLESRPKRLENRTPPAARRASWAELDQPEIRRPDTPRPDTPRPYTPRPDTPRQSRRHASHHDDLPGGLASIGLADEDEIEVPEEPAGIIASSRTAPVEPESVTPGEEESRPISVRRVDRSDPAYGSRVDGWIRPEYHDDPAESPSGEYWTPVPMENLDLPEEDPEPSARGYGWPTQVERLPAVPDYEPATGFDLTPVAGEPTELVPTWPPLPGERRRPKKNHGEPDERRVRLPHSWAGRDTKPADNRFLENEPRRARPEEADQRFRAPTGEPERRRPRPRPRPATSPDNVYVSRHAADPPH